MKSRFSCVSFGLRVSNFFRKVSESRICFFSRGSPAKVITLSEQSQCCCVAFTQMAARTELLLLLLYSLSPRPCSFDQVYADNNHAHALMLKSHENIVGGLYFESVKSKNSSNSI